jgi:hypothetical protein
MPEFDTTHLGQGAVGKVLKGGFPIRNRGSAPLEFSLKAGCACAELIPNSGTVEPGGSVPVHVGIRLRYRGKVEVVTVEVHTNDPKNPVGIHRVVAENVLPFVVSPASIDFGQVVDDGTPRTATFQVLDRTRLRLPKEVTVSATTGNLDYISVHPARTDPTGRTFEVILNGRAPRGHFASTVILHVSTDPDPFPVPVIGQVRGLVCFAPSTVYLPDRTKSQAATAAILVWRSDGQPLGRISKQILPKGISVEREGDVNAQRQKYKLTADDSWDTSQPGEVRLLFETVAEEIVIDVRPRESPGEAKKPPQGERTQ